MIKFSDRSIKIPISDPIFDHREIAARCRLCAGLLRFSVASFVFDFSPVPLRLERKSRAGSEGFLMYFHLRSRSRGRAAGGGTAPDTRRPSQRWKAPPPGTPSRHPHSEQRRPARAHAGGPVLGTHARIDRTRDTRVAEPWQPAPEDGRPGEGQRLTPGAPHNGGRHPSRGRPSATPTGSNAGPQGRTLWGRCRVHTPASAAPGTHGSRNPGSPLQRTGGRGRDSA